MATVTAVPGSKIRGGSFLIEERAPEEVFTPEDFSEQHLLIAQTAEEFANKEIVPNIENMEHKNFAIVRELVKKAGELGLSGVDVPEQYGGMEMDKVTAASAQPGAPTPALARFPSFTSVRKSRRRNICRDWPAGRPSARTRCRSHRPGRML